MRRRFLSVAALIFAAACGIADDSSITEPTLQRPLIPSPSIATCQNLTFAQVKTMLLALYADGSPDENAVKGKFDNMEHHFTNTGSIATAQQRAWDIAEYTLEARDSGKLPGVTNQQIADVLNAIFCLVGLNPLFGPNSFLIFPSDGAQILKTTDGFAGVSIPPNNVTVPTLLTITELTSPPPLDTKLDVYPLFYDFEITNASGAGSWVNPVIVGVCPPQDLDADVMANLLLGHQDGTTFELLEEADASFLNCSGVGGSSNIVVNADGDTTLVAAAVIGSAGVGGSTDNFSPIAPVDSRVVGSSGAGGTADNFRPRRNMGATSLNLQNFAVCPPVQALIGTEVDPACRPTITFATPLGTALEGIPVAWAIETGAGSIANPPSCSPFSSSFSQNTDANGVTTVCWKLGTTPGTNTVTATAGVGGDAPDGVNFVYSDGGGMDDDANKIRFTATGIKLATTTTVTCDPTSVVYNGQPQTPCTAVATSSDGLNVSVAVTYTNNTNVGTADANATYAGDATHEGSSGSATFTITQATSSTVVNCPATASFTGQPLTPCTATVTGAGGLNTTATVTYSNNTLIGTASASATYAGDANHTGSSGSATFIINNGYVQVGCFSSPVFSVMPTTKSAQNKGSNLPVKCTLKWPNGTSVTNATGSLQLWDLGTGVVDGSTPQPSGAPGLTIASAFAPTSNGNYSHQLNTNPAFYVAGRAYFIKATWSDGSTTTGYFRIK